MAGSSEAEVNQENLALTADQVVRLEVTVDKAQHVKVIQEEDGVAEDNFRQFLTTAGCWQLLLVQLLNMQEMGNIRGGRFDFQAQG